MTGPVSANFYLTWFEDSWRRKGHLMCGVALAVSLASCTSDTKQSVSTPEPPAPPARVTSAPSAPQSPVPKLHVTVQQQRFDGNTRTVGVETTNLGDVAVEVSSVQLVSDQFAGPKTSIGSVLNPGRTIAFRTSYGRPNCRATSGPVLARLDVAGTPFERPVDREGRQELRRLVVADCAKVQLGRIADIVLNRSLRRVVSEGKPWLRGQLDITRSSPGGTVDLRSFSGSVLVELRPAGRLRDLGESDERAITPVLIGSNGRCDEHALVESTRTFPLSAYVRRRDHPQQRVQLTPSVTAQNRILEVIFEACGVTRP